MKKVLIVSLVCIFVCSLSFAQDPVKDSAAIKEFTRTVNVDGVMVSFIHLNAHTVDLLFKAPVKYSMRARANARTLIWVQANPDRELDIDTSFTLSQDSKRFTGKSHNFKNFAGGPVTVGEPVNGLLEFDGKVNVSRSFLVQNSDIQVDFTFSIVALRMLGK